jgi:hypothetical protein
VRGVGGGGRRIARQARAMHAMMRGDARRAARGAAHMSIHSL